MFRLLLLCLSHLVVIILSTLTDTVFTIVVLNRLYSSYYVSVHASTFADANREYYNNNSCSFDDFDTDITFKNHRYNDNDDVNKDEYQQQSTCNIVDQQQVQQQQQQQHPNIILIVIDDLGSHDLGYHGTGIQTPVIDSLINDSGGLLLTNYYVLPYCSPTRAAILSGRYPLHTGCHTIIKRNETQGLPLDEIIIPQLLRSHDISVNYATHAVGKWHIGHAMHEQLPTHRGFESFFGYYRGYNDYYTHSDQDNRYDLHYDPYEYCHASNCSQYIKDERGNYSTHVFTREAIRVLKKHHTEQVSQNRNHHHHIRHTKPLFLYLAYQAVHGSETVPEHYVQPYKNHKHWTKQRQIYAGMLSAVDESIGNITKLLQGDELGEMWSNTILIVTTDNGGPTEICAIQGSQNHPSKRGGKCTIWEGGTTGDAIIAGPYFKRARELYQASVTASATRQTQKVGSPCISNATENTTVTATSQRLPNEYPHLFHAVDWLPTIAAMASVHPSYALATKPLDGVNQWDALISYCLGNQSSSLSPPPPREEVFVGYATFNNTWYGPAVRWKGWKLLQGVSGGPEKSVHLHPDYISPIGTDEPAIGGTTTNGTSYQLFNIEIDPGEGKDLSEEYPEIVTLLRNKLQHYQQTYVPPNTNNDDDSISCEIEHVSQANLDHHDIGFISQPWCKKLIIYESDT